MGLEALFLIGSSVAQATGMFMTVHGTVRDVPSKTPGESRALRSPRVSIVPSGGPSTLGATLTISGF